MKPIVLSLLALAVAWRHAHTHQTLLTRDPGGAGPARTGPADARAALARRAGGGPRVDGDAGLARELHGLGIHDPGAVLRQLLDRHGTGLSPSDVLVARGLAEVPGLLGLLGDPAAGGTGFGARPPGGYSSASGHGAPAERP